jgi:hypothetical protein
MTQFTAIAKRKVLRRVAPAVFVIIAGVGLTACGSGSGASGVHNNTTTTTPSSGGTAY